MSSSVSWRSAAIASFSVPPCSRTMAQTPSRCATYGIRVFLRRVVANITATTSSAARKRSE
jgi:hypothetical protein